MLLIQNNSDGSERNSFLAPSGGYGSELDGADYEFHSAAPYLSHQSSSYPLLGCTPLADPQPFRLLEFTDDLCETLHGVPLHIYGLVLNLLQEGLKKRRRQFSPRLFRLSGSYSRHGSPSRACIRI